MDIHDLQATVTAGSCSSRVVFNVPKARSQGLEIEFEDAPNRNVSFAISGSFNNSELRTTLTSTDPSGAVSVVSGIKKGERLPTVPKIQIASAITYQQEVRQGGLAYVTGTYQHIGSRLTQVRSEEHTSELQSPYELVCRLLLEKNKDSAQVMKAVCRPQHAATLGQC